MKLKYSTTLECFNDIIELISGGKQKEAGDIFEEFLKIYFIFNSIYKEVYNTNRSHEIPQWILKKINAESLVESSTDSPLIDLIGIDHHGDIDVIQGKSSMHINSNAGINLATGLMSSIGNPLQNVKNYVFCTMHKDVSKLFDIWNVISPKIYKYEDFLPGEGPEDILQDITMWEQWNKKNITHTAVKSGIFTPRGPQQTEYINACELGLSTQLQLTGRAKGYAKGAGALGKSWLAPVICANIQNKFWNKMRTNSPQPVHVSFFHSSQTINENGYTEVKIRKSFNIHDEVFVISGTDVIDKDNAENASSKFTKMSCNNHVKIVEKLIETMNNGRSVHLITLYHHSEDIAEILRLLKKEYKGFEFWSRRRDECDWPCSNYHSSYSAALDDRTQSIVTFGDTGTDRFGDPHKDYGTNNMDIHGPLLHSYTWANAERDELVKPLILIPVVVTLSSMISNFPGLVDKKGNFDFNARVIGKQIDNTFPTTYNILTIAAVQKALCSFPQIKRPMQFSSRVKTNALIRENWKWVADKVLGKTKTENNVRDLYKNFEVINDDQYNAHAVKSSLTSLKRCKSVERSIMGSCRVFNRGWNDVPPKGYQGDWKRFHAGWHTNERSIVELVQEIWRFTRLDSQDDDPFSYYIQPLILNDINSAEPHWSKQNLKHLVNILKSNKNIADEFESIQKGGGGSAKQKKKRLQFIWPEGFDPSLIDFAINSIALEAGGGKLYPDLATEAHDWLTNEYFKLSEPENAQHKGKIHKRFYEIIKFKPLYSHYKNHNTWRERFYHGNYNFDPIVKQHINDNLMAYKKYCKQQKNWIEEKKNIVRDIVEKGRKMQIHLDKNYFPGHPKLCDQFGWDISRSHSYVEKHCSDIRDDPLIEQHITNVNIPHVFDCLNKTASDSECMEEWAGRTADIIDRNIIDVSIFDVPIFEGRLAKENESGKVRWLYSVIQRKFIKSIPSKGLMRTNNTLTTFGFNLLDKNLQDQLIIKKKLVHTRSILRGKLDQKNRKKFKTLCNLKYTSDENKEIIKWLLGREKFILKKKHVWRPCSNETKKKISEANIKAGKFKRGLLEKQLKYKNQLLAEVFSI